MSLTSDRQKLAAANSSVASKSKITPLGSAAISAGASIVGGIIGGGYDNQVGSAMQSLSGLAGAIPGVGTWLGPALSIAGGTVSGLFGSKKNTKNIANVESHINYLDQLQSNASDYDQLAADYSGLSQINFNKGYLGRDGIFSNAISNLYNDLSNQQQIKYDQAQRRLQQSADNIQQNTMLNLGYNSAAYGGPLLYAGGGGIHIKPSKRGTFTAAAKQRGLGVQEFASKVLANKEDYSSAMVKKANFARNASKWNSFGGWLNAHGSDFNSGLTEVNEGGTHEQNPNQGVLMGIDQEGTPNLVEEGEVVVKDLGYVFSNRLKVPNSIKKSLGIRGKNQMTFADAMKYLSKESEERPNDPISRVGLDDNITKLVTIQEALRQLEGMDNNIQQNNRFDSGGPFSYDNKTTGIEYDNIYNEDGTINFDNLYADNSEYMRRRQYILDNYDKPEIQDWVKNTYIPYINSYNSSRGTNVKSITRDQFEKYTKDKKWGAWHSNLYASTTPGATVSNNNKIAKVDLPMRFNPLADAVIPVKPPIIGKPSTLPTQDKKKKSEDSNLPLFDDPLRYAPVVGSAVGAVNGLFTNPDYEFPDKLIADYNTRMYNPIGYTRLGNRLKYSPIDIDTYINPIMQQYSADRRAILNNTGLTSGTANANLLAARRSFINSIGEARAKAASENFNRLKEVETFNRATEDSNAARALSASQSNLSAQLTARQAQLQGLSGAYAAKQKIKEDRQQTISDNLSTLFESLGQIGKERVYRKMLTWEDLMGINEPRGKSKEK